MASVATRDLPPSQRPTPTKAIRLHKTTFAQLSELRLPAETWESFFVRTILTPRAIQPSREPRHRAPRQLGAVPGGVRPDQASLLGDVG